MREGAGDIASGACETELAPENHRVGEGEKGRERAREKESLFFFKFWLLDRVCEREGGGEV